MTGPAPEYVTEVDPALAIRRPVHEGRVAVRNTMLAGPSAEAADAEPGPPQVTDALQLGLEL